MPPQPSQHILDTISQAIHRSDKSVFFESYHKQARTVIKDLLKEGYVIAPQNPSKDAIESATSILTDGRHRPRDVVKNIYLRLITPFLS